MTYTPEVLERLAARHDAHSVCTYPAKDHFADVCRAFAALLRELDVRQPSTGTDRPGCPSCDRDLSAPGLNGHECYTYAEHAERIAANNAVSPESGPGLDLNALAATNAERCTRWHPPESEPWSLADWSNAMTGEAGEAANMVKKLRRIETRTDTGPWEIPHATIPGRMVGLDRGQQSRILAKGIGLELADVVIYADLLAQELSRKYGGYSLSELIVTKFNAVSHREGYPERLGLPYESGGPAQPGQELRSRGGGTDG